MRIGIDFGTTHTVAAVVDKGGNYRVVSFGGVDRWPSVIAANAAGELRFGLDAAAVRHEPGWSVLRSFKRLLNDAGPQTVVELGGRSYRLADLLTSFLTQLKRDLQHRSNAPLAPGERVEAAISVPANASSAQRFLTLDAFAEAGFEVVALLNEPSAAGLEYADRYRCTITAKREYVLIYDLGGGTFDASLLKMTGRLNEVVTSEGIQRLGGDDFDEAICQLVLNESRLSKLDAATHDLLLEECAVRKEAVGANTRRFLVDLSAADAPPFCCSIDDVYAACAPLVEQTITVLSRVLRDPARDGADVDPSEVAGIYAVGGAGSFPLVARMLRRSFGDKHVKRSPHPFAATAVGLAVFLDTHADFALSERLSRHFGVFREAHRGADVTFDPILPKDLALPPDGQPPLVVTRSYRAAHNIGHFRFVECSRLCEGRPDGDVTPYDPVFFPFDPDLHDQQDLGRRPVGRREDGPDVEERYVITPGGAVEVTLTTRPGAFARTFRLRDTSPKAPDGSATSRRRKVNTDAQPKASTPRVG
ncbi:MAG: Hsp70 family protein [Acidimicrobiia bacterium]|nr:Hsp70 family protein [Acidimicrobiia bacterium]